MRRAKSHYLIAFLLSSILSVGYAEVNFGDAPAAMNAVSALPVVRVDGNRFVGESGETMVFRGLALADPYHLDKSGKWTREYFEAARSWNANIVRIPVHPACWRDWGSAKYIRMIDDAVAWASDLGLYVIIDWHTIGNPQNGVAHRPSYLTTREETFNFWYLMANRYRNNPTVAFFELFNEPTNRRGMMGTLTWEFHKSYMEELIRMIHAIDPSKIVLVAGFDWAYELRNAGADPIEAENVAYVTHPYPQKRPEPWEGHWQEDWGFLAERFPIMATEFGFMSADGPGAHSPVIADERYGEALIRFFNERGISWTAWVFDPQWSPQLIEDWDYTPTAQGQYFRDVLMRDNPRQ